MKQLIFLTFLIGLVFGYSYAESQRPGTIRNLSELGAESDPHPMKSKYPELENSGDESKNSRTGRFPASANVIEDEGAMDLDEENSIGQSQW